MQRRDSSDHSFFPAHLAEAGSFLSRREFLHTTALAGLALAVTSGCATTPRTASVGREPYEKLSADLLRDWCDGMLALQINNPAKPAEHGALGCPACGIIHGRCLDAVYPFLHQAKVSGDKKYLAAGIAVFEWGKNVSHEDGSWTVIADPKSWKGITVFGAIALAEALHYHGDLLDAETRTRWTERLGRAADYLYANFTSLDFSNVNYGCTGTYAFHLLGHSLNRPEYFERSRKLASEVKNYLSTPNGLLFGEGKPADGKSPRGCVPVDLGYNVEESLVALALYAEASGDAEFRKLVTRTMRAHLEFMLPDGGWDNSFGTRMAKWTYWGSRTSDGCQPGFAMLAKDEPAFATAAYENARLYRRCTANGLLHGGPHYASHGVPPCVHHTFTHAKALAAVLDHVDLARKIVPAAPLPRAVASGVREYPELATWLIARGPWRATLTANDWVYRKQVFQPTGGTISMLWHRDVGPLLAGSLAKYIPVESYNMQPLPPGGDQPLTPRLEFWEDGVWFTNLHDYSAQVAHSRNAGAEEFQITTQLRNEQQESPASGPVTARINYRFDKTTVEFTIRVTGGGARPVRFTLPVISPSGERVGQPRAERVEILKPQGRVVIAASVPLRLPVPGEKRIFNLIPGFEAVPIVVEMPARSDASFGCLVRIRID